MIKDTTKKTSTRVRVGSEEGTGHNKRTINKRRNHGKDSGGGARKKKDEHLGTYHAVPTADTQITNKPVIESSNPFFIAVCAPETYKSRRGGGGRHERTRGNGSSEVEERDKSNVFLRQRHRTTVTRNDGGETNRPNRFIQHSRENQMHAASATATATATANTNDLEHFPSLGVNLATAPPKIKLNFKEMVIRNSPASATASATASANVSTVSEAHHTIIYPRMSPSVSLSTNNIFLAAFQKQSFDTDDDHDTDYRERFVSSALIDSCDTKYDKLYH